MARWKFMPGASEESGYSRSKIFRLIRKKLIRAKKDGGRVIVDMEFVDAYRESLPDVKPVYRRPSKDQVPSAKR